jgi:hypothetical protein
MERHVHHSVQRARCEQKCEVKFHSSREDTAKSEQWFCCGYEDAYIRDHLCGLSNKVVGDNAVVESAGLCQQDSIPFFASGYTASSS